MVALSSLPNGELLVVKVVDIAAPDYNFGLSLAMKVWVDHLVRSDW